jgi:heat shock protein HslJ
MNTKMWFVIPAVALATSACSPSPETPNTNRVNSSAATVYVTSSSVASLKTHSSMAYSSAISPATAAAAAVTTAAANAANATASAAAAAADAATSTAAAATSAAAEKLGTIKLVSTYWKLVQLDGKEVVASGAREPHVVFDTDNRVAGSDGCNRVVGGYTSDGNKLSFSQLASTKMACPESDDAYSAAYGKALSNVSQYTLNGDFLELKDSAGKLVARFKSATAPD